MKQILLFSLVLLAAFCYSQDCSNYYYLKNNSTVEMSIYDKKGGISGRLVYSVSGVTNSNNITTASVKSEMFDKKGRTIATGSSIMKCNGGIMMINMKMVIPTPQAEQISQTSAKTEDFFIEYPLNMKTGDQLKDGNMNMEVNNNGIQQSVSMIVYDRMVEDKERISTAAGSWDCYRISYKSKMSIKMMGVGIPVSMDGTEWYAPGFGVVKTISKHGTTEITSIK